MRVELWSAKINREKLQYRDTRTIDRVTYKEPLFGERIDLPIDRVLVVGRLGNETFPMRPGSLHRYFSAKGRQSGVSKRAIELFYDKTRWRVETDQPSGFTMQEWGSHERAVVHYHALKPKPTSIRVDGSDRLHWVLLQPEESYRPSPKATGQVLDGEGTDPPPSGYFPAGSDARAELDKATPALCAYYSQYLEWPPRPKPERVSQVPPGYTGNFALDIYNLRVHAATFGYPATTESGREPELITWLTSNGNLPFDEYHTDSQLGQ